MRVDYGYANSLVNKKGRAASVRRQVGAVFPDPLLDVGLPPDLAHPEHLVGRGEVTSRSDN